MAHPKETAKELAEKVIHCHPKNEKQSKESKNSNTPDRKIIVKKIQNIMNTTLANLN